MCRPLLLVLTMLLGGHGVLRAAEYQWSVTVSSVVSGETKSPPRAFLWIPPTCQRVRAVVLAQHNMLEIPLLEHPEFRQAMAELSFAIVWITPPPGGAEKFVEEDATHFEAALRALADASGYGELAEAPVVPIGHSAMAEFPYLVAAHWPQRTLAAVSLKGSWPDLDRKPPQPWIERFAASGVPLLFVSGEYEWAEERAGRALAFRRQFPAAPLSMLADAGGGHFDHHAALTRFIAGYLRAAAEHRLGDHGLLAIDATQWGWRVDRWHMDQAPRAAAAPVARYAGDSSQTYWCFDETQAQATERLQSAHARKQPQLLGYRQDGAVVPQVNGTHQQVTLAWRPEPDGDGLTFRLSGAFLDTVPEGRPERWTKLKAGAPIAHALGGGPVVIEPICGPVVKLTEDTFALRFDRVGFDNLRRSAEIWFQAVHPGDAQFKRAVQQALLRVPLRNTLGTPQTLRFDPIPDQKAGCVDPIPMHATSSAGAKVRFYVREGPAEVEGDHLKLSALPPRAKLPIPVTVVAWQWGRSTEPRLQSAEPVVHRFQVTR